jgi:hypothetical protein
MELFKIQVYQSKACEFGRIFLPNGKKTGLSGVPLRSIR